jgi:hypothetical protein
VEKGVKIVGGVEEDVVEEDVVVEDVVEEDVVVEDVVEEDVEVAGEVLAVFTWCQLWCEVPGIMEHLTRAAGDSVRAFLPFRSISPSTFTRHYIPLHQRHLHAIPENHPPIGNSRGK